MNFYIRKLTTLYLSTSLLCSNISLASLLPQQYDNNIEAKLEQIFQENQQEYTDENAEEYNYLKAGDEFTIELLDEIDSETANLGDIIKARLVYPLEIDGKIIAPEGSVIYGKIAELQKKGIWYKSAKLKVIFEEIECSKDNRLPIIATIKTKDNTGILTGADKSQQIKDILSLLTITSVGGAITGFGFGLMTPYALVGGVLGASMGFFTGIGWLLFHKGAPVSIPLGTNLIITLENDVAISNEL